jgi:hypothetical protein
MAQLSTGEEYAVWMSAGIPELADMAPVPRSNGPCHFREAMEYFRALYTASKRNPRALRHTAEAIHLNPDSYTVRLSVPVLSSPYL